MNNRIKELIEQATSPPTRIQGFGGEPTHIYPGNLDVEKLVELVVLECETVAKNPQWYSESPSNGWRNPIRHVCNAMKQHFGIDYE